MVDEVVYAAVLLVWVIVVVKVLTKRIYDRYVSRGVDGKVMVYYNRKIIHILAGGIISLLTPFIFRNPFIILAFSIILTIFSLIPYKTGRLNYWYQVSGNIFDVHFCLMWGLVMFLSKFFLNDWWTGVVPVLFMSVGDAVTGIVRNAFFRKRTKSWWGNLAMLLTCLPIGALLGFKGVFSAFVVSLIERYEYKWVDDNITVPLVSFFILSAFH